MEASGAGPIEASELAGVALFEGLSEDDLAAIGAKMRRLHVPVGDVLAGEGELSSKAFVILRGSMTVHREGRHIADLGAGDIVGEVGTAGLLRRNATVIATTPSMVAVLMGWDLRGLIERFPPLKERIEAVAASRATHA